MGYLRPGGGLHPYYRACLAGYGNWWGPKYRAAYVLDYRALCACVSVSVGVTQRGKEAG